MQIISGQLIDVHQRKIFGAEIHIENGKIHRIVPAENAGTSYILPGFIDAHIHIESSMLVPYEFARIALRHGTVATVSDPHEIANVCGIDGVNYMIANARDALLKFHFGAPSCVPATSFETAGAKIDASDVEGLLQRDDIYFLSEMMNYPGVLHRDSEVLQKIEAAKKIKKPVDGHAPGLSGMDADTYIEAGITTDHECYTLDEARYKIAKGMKVIIREGSAARNYEALHPLIGMHPDMLMFCSDDKHPDDLMDGHINMLVARAIKTYDLFDVLHIACVHPVIHYQLPVGLLRPGDPADFIQIKDLQSFQIESTYIDGICVFDGDSVFLPQKSHDIINNFNTKIINPSSLAIFRQIVQPIIKAIDGELITDIHHDEPDIHGELWVSSTERDILKICVVNRYTEAPPAIAFIHGFGLKIGAIASSVAHDSHNIVAVGTDDESIANAINLVIEQRGGLSFYASSESRVLPLPVAGLMHTETAGYVAEQYTILTNLAKHSGCTLRAPYMTLSFMALLVIPALKMSDKGLFDAVQFKFIHP